MNKGKCWDLYDLIERDERRKQSELRRMERDKEWRLKNEKIKQRVKGE